jgi:hypothetical protein
MRAMATAAVWTSAIANRIQKLLEQCNIKLASVASDVLGVSAMAMLRALAQGETDATRMADMAKRLPATTRLPAGFVKTNRGSQDDEAASAITSDKAILR